MSTNEWYTRPPYIAAAREVMGSIGLDPASCLEANRIVQAERFFTEKQNGLLKEAMNLMIIMLARLLLLCQLLFSQTQGYVKILIRASPPTPEGKGVYVVRFWTP